MKKWILGTIVAFAACFATYQVVTNISDSTEAEPVAEAKFFIFDGDGNLTVEGDLNDLGQLVEEFNKRKAENEAIAKSQEIPMSEENYKKLVAFVNQNGVLINGEDRAIFFKDSKGGMHVLTKLNLDTFNSVPAICIHSDGTASYYEIDSRAIHPFNNGDGTSLVNEDGTWPGADAARTIYEEFLKKIFTQSPGSPGKGTKSHTSDGRREYLAAFFV